MTSIFDALNIAVRHINEGRPDMARKIYARILAADPLNAVALARLKTLGVKVDNTSSAVISAHRKYTSPGSLFEEIDLEIGKGKSPKVNILAYYLPQFYESSTNNKFWGSGFTEWTNVTRGLPRFHGQIQPRIPRDLGFYDLSHESVIHRQAALAKSMGVYGFCFYHYFFDGRRELDRPMRMLLDNKSIDMPFCIMWANENWTRSWDGREKDILVEQDYDPSHDLQFVNDLAEHFFDHRYIKIGDRPLFFIYSVSDIPNFPQRVAKWRQLLRQAHNLNPLIYMVDKGQGHPSAFGLDGSIEFPPHKVNRHVRNVATQKTWLDPTSETRVVEYSEIAKTMLGYGLPQYPHIKCIVPGWDNDARKPGRGLSFSGSTPKMFARWLELTIRQVKSNTFDGGEFVAINAWNEWAEGAILEPDVHFGGAYLNALARTVFE